MSSRVLHHGFSTRAVQHHARVDKGHRPVLQEAIAICSNELIQSSESDHFVRVERLGKLRPDSSTEVRVQRLHHHHQIAFGVESL